MKTTTIETKIKDIDNTSFLTEYENIRNDLYGKHLTDQNLKEVLARWKCFIFKLIDRNLIDRYVGYSLIDMFKETLTLTLN